MVEMVSLISSILIWKLVKNGCTTYLVVVKDLNQLILGFENMPIVKEFIYVFIEELTQLPPNREIEFAIDLVLETKPVSIPLYQMAPIGLKELKVQLQELIDKEFVHPSSSP